MGHAVVELVFIHDPTSAVGLTDAATAELNVHQPSIQIKGSYKHTTKYDRIVQL